MGMYDSVWVQCVRCGKLMEFQSKAADCLLTRYSLDDAPDSILRDLEGATQVCEECGEVNKIKLTVRTVVLATVV